MATGYTINDERKLLFDTDFIIGTNEIVADGTVRSTMNDMTHGSIVQSGASLLQNITKV